MTVSPSKSISVQRKIRYLHMIVDGKDLSMDPEMIKIIRNLPEPKSRRGLMKIGMTNFYSKYIKGYCELVEPLHRLRSSKVGGMGGLNGGMNRDLP